MNRTISKKIAEKITNEQLDKMFKSAKMGIKDWKAISNVNPIMTKGTSWNILASDFDINKNYHILAKINMVREFGEFLPKDFVETFKVNRVKVNIDPVHQEPIFKKI